MTTDAQVDEPISDREIETALKGSGFPFQTGVRDKIRRLGGFEIYASEYPWHNDKDEFLDLVVINDGLSVAIECKKTKQEKYIFLLPNDEGNTTGFRCIRVGRFQDGSPRISYIQADILPPCPSAEFCIVRTNTRERMLERDAALLVKSCDALVRDPHEAKLNETLRLVIPVLITNADLFSARYNPMDVSLHSGEFTQMPKLQKQPFMRFSKTFTAGRGYQGGLRTIFVVNALSLGEFFISLGEISGHASRPA